MQTQEKTLFDVLRDVWKAKLYLVFFGFVSLVLAVVFLKSATPYYKAEMVIAPAHAFAQSAFRAPEGSLHVQPEHLGGDAAFSRFAQIYALPSLASALLEQDGVEAGIQKDRAFAFSGSSLAQGTEYFKRHVTLEPVSGTPFRRMVYMHPDPYFATKLLNQIHALADDRIRQSVLRETNERIAYLNAGIGRSMNPEHKRTLAALMMEQERVRMMVSLDQPFAASVIEPAFVSSKPRWPDRFVIFPVFLFVGLLIGFIVYGLRHNG